MAAIPEIFRTHSPEYIDRFGASISKEHRKVINAITQCRTEAAGVAVYECRECGETYHVNRSCGNRHCPTCQNDKTHQWLARQLKRQLPGHHFMMTFTVPENLRPTIRSHQKIAYSALFKASSDSIKLLLQDPKFMGGDLPGFYGVLHTSRAHPGVPSPHPLHHRRRGSVDQRRQVASIEDRFLPAGRSTFHDL